ncbi:unnamed protein product [Lampetra planeri]
MAALASMREGREQTQPRKQQQQQQQREQQQQPRLPPPSPQRPEEAAAAMGPGLEAPRSSQGNTPARRAVFYFVRNPSGWAAIPARNRLAA